MGTSGTNWETRVKANTKLLKVWSGAWTASMALATFGPRFFWDFNETLTIISIILNVTLGIGMIFANKNFIKELDELQKKIQMDAMAIALGVAVVFGLSFSLLEQSHVISFKAEISHLVILIGLTYLTATIIGRRKYS